MNKEEILKVIVESARIYEENLVNKNMLFLFTDKNKNNRFFEALFEPRHFHHFTGTNLTKPNSTVHCKNKVEHVATLP